MDFDYDNMITTSTYAKWRDVIYYSLDDFRYATGYEKHGISANSKFVNASGEDFHLQATSPNIDKGAILTGFNDANSPWPYRGAAPDIGAHEYGSGIPPATEKTPDNGGISREGNPAGAYPFTSEEREHKVHINGVTAHCMCALDALAVSPMFNTPTVIDSQCRATGDKIHIEQNGTGFTGGTLDAWFGINWGAAKSDAVCAASLCMEMMFLANEKVARGWLAESAETREIFDLPSAVEFAAGFFVPLAESCRQAAGNS